MQITKYSDRIDQLSGQWTEKNIEKMVDEAHGLNVLAREAEHQADIESEKYYADLEKAGFMNVRPAERKTVGIFGMIGWYVGRLLWKNTR